MVFFLLFHASMNLVAIIKPSGYNKICEFLGANWYALVATVGLAALMVFHLIYAFVLSLQNYRARGSQRYAVVEKQEGVSWASKNMLVIGVIVLVGLGLHLFNFWANTLSENKHLSGRKRCCAVVYKDSFLSSDNKTYCCPRDIHRVYPTLFPLY